ncbi:MAG: peptidase E [Cyanobacteria bacterium P01_A01_bin.15]
MKVSQQIIALGGGGFSMEPDNLALDRYLLEQTGKPRPKVCFVPTASGDSDNYIRRFYESLCTLDCTPSHLALFQSPVDDLQSYALEQDLIYVGGGNTRNLLAIWRDWGLDRVFRTALEHGVVLAGISAGSICWFEQGVTDSMTPKRSTQLASINCLGFLEGSNCPHYDSEENRRREYHRLLKSREIVDGWAADDGVALHFVNGSIKTIVSSRTNVYAYRVRTNGEEIHEEQIEPHCLKIL